MKVQVGDKVYVPNEKKPYKVRCRDDRYIICTKPDNLHHSVWYFVIDLVEKWRAPDDRIFCFGKELEAEINRRLVIEFMEG